MPPLDALSAHLRRRRVRLRELYRGHLFVLAGRYRSVLRTRDRHGNAYLVSTADTVIGPSLFVSGGFDAGKLDRALRLLDEQGIAITRALDIGANIGTTTLELLAWRPDLRIDCFEPEPANHRLLTANLAANARGRARAQRPSAGLGRAPPRPRAADARHHHGRGADRHVHPLALGDRPRPGPRAGAPDPAAVRRAIRPQLT